MRIDNTRFTACWGASDMARSIRGLLAGILTMPALALSQSYEVTNGNASGAGSLAAAIEAANAWNTPTTFTINIVTTDTIMLSSQLVIGLKEDNTAGLIINGGGATIDMAQANGGAGDRAIFIADGHVTISNLTISNGKAVGGNGSYGAGGGAGLGGGIFVANSSWIPGTPQLASNLVLNDVYFTNNQANGGSGTAGSSTYEGSANGGGGGMGGNGGASYVHDAWDGHETGGGGGGGFGYGADGGLGNSNNGSSGALTVSSSGGGEGGEIGGGDGGAFGGGGGGGDSGVVFDGGGGGGGAGGANADGDTGGHGGFGGGGGGGGWNNSNGGNGGFGGGGGAGGSNPGVGGFGGGGGAGSENLVDGTSGFGGGTGYTGQVGDGFIALGGGGAGLGGGIFVMTGATVEVNYSGSGSPSPFSNNSVNPGSGAQGGGYYGSAYGPNVFLGGDMTFSTSSTMYVSGLGGAGNTADPNVRLHADDPNANGGIIVAGTGKVVLSGPNTYSGSTTVNSGTLATTGASPAMASTSAVTINAGGTLSLGQSNGVNSNAPVNLNGGTIELSGTVQQTFGTLTVSAGSVLDFGGNTNSSLTFSSMTIDAPLSVWNYMNVVGAMNVLNQTLSAEILAKITFYSDAGVTVMGQTMQVGNYLTPALSTISVSNGQQMTGAVALANAMTTSSTIEITENATIQPDAQLFVSLNSANTGGVTIQGNNATVDMSQANGGAGDRAFFVASGNVTINDLTIANGKAVGGDGVQGGGGGAGLGGGLFVANLPQQEVAGYTQAANVTLDNVSFVNNKAEGGDSSNSGYTSGGGGGMGGNGGSQNIGELEAIGGGGGGGFGYGADGGTNSAGQPGAFIGGAPGGDSMAPARPGGANGGGGGGAYGDASGPTGTGDTSGGGGGVGGQSVNTGIHSTNRADGGFGGGGAGTGVNNYGGYGGFGGGGGSASEAMEDAQASFGGNGGFGGGGGLGLKGTSVTAGTPGKGGFGAGGGALLDLDGAIPSQPLSENTAGGGGLGAGGAVFVMGGASLTIINGSFSSNTTTPGTGFANGSAYGDDVFLGGTTVFQVDGSNTVTVSNLGGAGNKADPNVSSNASDPNANGGLTKTGTGTLALSGTNYYSGATVISAGTLHITEGSTESGTSSIIVGQSANAELWLDTNSVITSGTPDQSIVLGGASGVQGTLTIGSGTNGAGIGGFSTITTGGGTGLISFNVSAPVNTPSGPYPFYPTITGDISIEQNGTGTTILQPGSPNTYTGSTTVNAGTLATVGNGSLGYHSFVTVADGASLELAGNESVGSLAGGGSISIAGELTSGGNDASTTFSGDISGAGSLVKIGAGEQVLGGVNTFTGSISITEGTLQFGSGATVSGSNSLSISGTLDINGGDFTFQGATLTGGTITDSAGGGTLDIEGAFVTSDGIISANLGGTLDAGIQQTGSGMTILTGDNSSSLAGMTITSGTLQIGNGGTSGTLTNTNLIELTSILAFRLSNDYLFGNNIAIFGGGTLIQRGSGTLDIQSFSLGVGALIVESGTMIVDSLDVGPSITNNPTLEVQTNATFTLANRSTSFSDLSGEGTITLDSASLILNATEASAFSGAMSGTGGFTKMGNGTFTYGGAASYQGQTLVSAGTYIVNGSIGAASSVQVNSGAKLGGSGTIAGPVNVQGTLSPGSSVESLAVGSVNFAGGATYDYEFDSAAAASVGADLLAVAGDLDLADSAGTILTITDLSDKPVAFTIGTVFTLISYGGTWNREVFTFNGTPLTQGSLFNAGLNQWQIDYMAESGGSNYTADYIDEGRFVNITAVPEPSIYGLMLLALTSLFALRFRRTAKTP